VGGLWATNSEGVGIIVRAAYNWVLGAEPPAGSRGRALVRESGGEAPQKLKAFLFLDV